MDRRKFLTISGLGLLGVTSSSSGQTMELKKNRRRIDIVGDLFYVSVPCIEFACDGEMIYDHNQIEYNDVWLQSHKCTECEVIEYFEKPYPGMEFVIGNDKVIMYIPKHRTWEEIK